MLESQEVALDSPPVMSKPTMARRVGGVEMQVTSKQAGREWLEDSRWGLGGGLGG